MSMSSTPTPQLQTFSSCFLHAYIEMYLLGGGGKHCFKNGVNVHSRSISIAAVLVKSLLLIVLVIGRSI